MSSRHALPIALGLALAACRGELSDERAERLVRAYNERLVEAYRLGDPRLLEGVAGDEEAEKLTGLIGVKADMGITLDARLLELRVTAVERPARQEVHLLTEERWHYRDRRIGSGEQVGKESTDSYRMRYLLRRVEAGWRVAELRFETPPEVGRTEAPVTGDARVFHGLEATNPPPGDGERSPAIPEAKR